jgi:hypothetical protein
VSPVPQQARRARRAAQDKQPMRWSSEAAAPRDAGSVLPSADIKLMIMTAGGVWDRYCHPLTTPMS